MLSVLSILAVLSVVGGALGAGANVGHLGALLAPVTGGVGAESGAGSLEYILMGIAISAAVIGWFLADRMYRQKSPSLAELEAEPVGARKILVHKYYVDEFYGAAIIKPILVTSTYVLDWVVDKAILGGAAWILAGTSKFCGALLQRWQSGNIRSYAAWLAVGAAALLLFITIPYLLGAYGIDIRWGGH